MSHCLITERHTVVAHIHLDATDMALNDPRTAIPGHSHGTTNICRPIMKRRSGLFRTLLTSYNSTRKVLQTREVCHRQQVPHVYSGYRCETLVLLPLLLEIVIPIICARESKGVLNRTATGLQSEYPCPLNNAVSPCFKSANFQSTGSCFSSDSKYHT